MIKLKLLKNYYRNQKGIGLVEVIAALGISIVVITSLVSLTLFTLRTSLQSNLLLEGTKTANKQMELVRAYRDSQSWSDFLSAMGGCSTSCSLNTSLNLSNSTSTYGTGTNAITYFFKATKPDGVSVVSGSDNDVRIYVEANWRVGSQVKKTYLYTDLTNWQNK